MIDFAALHLLRPWWLLALLPAAFLVLVLWRRQGDVAWRRHIPEHLLAHLHTSGDARPSLLRPWQSLAIFSLLLIVALAGPSWKREATPFADDQAALVIALYVGPSMLAEDVQPTRLERATHKIRDLLALRPGARVALVAYAGSAHVVIPFTSDANLVAEFAGELSPDVMPVEGSVPGSALLMSQSLLQSSRLKGGVLLITDSIDRSEFATDVTTAAVDILGMAAPPGTPAPLSGPPAPALDLDAFSAAADALGGRFVQATVDQADVELLSRRLDTRAVDAPDDEGERWQDSGYFLVFPAALLVLLWFRRGWVVRW
jgi:Ca-activated chloride channel family protein